MGQYIQTRIEPHREMVEGIPYEFPKRAPEAYIELWGWPTIHMDTPLKESTQKNFLGEKFVIYSHIISNILDTDLYVIYNRLI